MTKEKRSVVYMYVNVDGEYEVCESVKCMDPFKRP